MLPAEPLEKARAIAHVCEMDQKLYAAVEERIYDKAVMKAADEATLKELNGEVDRELGVWEAYLEKVGARSFGSDGVV